MYNQIDILVNLSKAIEDHGQSKSLTGFITCDPVLSELIIENGEVSVERLGVLLQKILTNLSPSHKSKKEKADYELFVKGLRDKIKDLEAKNPKSFDKGGYAIYKYATIVERIDYIESMFAGMPALIEKSNAGEYESRDDFHNDFRALVTQSMPPNWKHQGINGSHVEWIRDNKSVWVVGKSEWPKKWRELGQMFDKVLNHREGGYEKLVKTIDEKNPQISAIATALTGIDKELNILIKTAFASVIDVLTKVAK